MQTLFILSEFTHGQKRILPTVIFMYHTFNKIKLPVCLYILRTSKLKALEDNPSHFEALQVTLHELSLKGQIFLFLNDHINFFA